MPRNVVLVAGLALLAGLSPTAPLSAGGNLVLGGGIVFSDGSVQTTAASIRLFYATVDLVTGASALSACDTGFHMASIWELVSLADVRYDTTRGFTLADSGQGAPFALAWLRTGKTFSDLNLAGTANCNAWTTNSDQSFGTRAALNSASGSATLPGSPWLLSSSGCNTVNRVWCIQD